MTHDFYDWIQYFTLNRENLLAIDWQDSYVLSETEKDCIYHSLQQFQRGEYSEGKFLMRQAKEFFKDKEDDGYIEALILFIREEQRHGLTLGRFMDQQGISKLNHHWLDTIFRHVRRMSRLEGSVIALTVAELISAVYYQALKYATRSPILTQLCSQILWDEDHHLQFQAQTFRMFTHKHGAKHRLWIRIRLMTLLSGTILLVWWQHKAVLKRGGFRFRRFWRDCWSEERKLWRRVRDQHKVPALDTNF